MATHTSILAWEIPWTEESMGLQRIRHYLVTKQQQQKQSIKKLFSNFALVKILF